MTGCPMAAGGSASIDLVSAELYSSGDPHAIWREQRRSDPVRWHPVGDDSGFWSITRHHDVSTVLRDHESFSSEHGTLLNLLGKDDPAAGRQLAVTDPPQHGRMREPLQQALSIRTVESYRGNIRELVRELLAPLADGGPFDLAEAMSAVPMAVTGTMMGLPRSDWAELTRLATASLAAEDPKFGSPGDPEETLRQSHRAIFAYFQDVLTERGASPGDDLIGTLLTMEVEGRRLAPGEILANCYSLLIGATVTTPQVPTAAVGELAGTGELERWAFAPELVNTGVEEAVRWASPTNHFMRYAVRDQELSGTPIRAGEPVVVWLGSANRDEEVFDDPFTFDVARKPNKHVAFGAGPHHCIGHTIARVTLRVVFGELLGRFTDFALDRPPVRLRSNIIAGLGELVVTARPRDELAPLAEAP